MWEHYGVKDCCSFWRKLKLCRINMFDVVYISLPVFYSENDLPARYFSKKVYL